MPARWQPSLEDYIDIATYLLDAGHAAIAGLPRLAWPSPRCMPRSGGGRVLAAARIESQYSRPTQLVERVAAGQATHEEVVAWIRDRTRTGGR